MSDNNKPKEGTWVILEDFSAKYRVEGGWIYFVHLPRKVIGSVASADFTNWATMEKEKIHPSSNGVFVPDPPVSN
jgi:hypothetical protein